MFWAECLWHAWFPSVVHHLLCFASCCIDAESFAFLQDGKPEHAVRIAGNTGSEEWRFWVDLEEQVRTCPQICRSCHCT